jgi:hypothetical protein
VIARQTMSIAITFIEKLISDGSQAFGTIPISNDAFSCAGLWLYVMVQR